MPPRKAAATDDNTTADPPRRSGRIASQPVPEAISKPKAKVTKKRTAGDEAKDGEGATAKKVLKFFLFFPPFFGGGVIYTNSTSPSRLNLIQSQRRREEITVLCL
jgi:hypothetical protein